MTKTCSICLNPLTSSKNMTTRFSCGHEFHEKCIRSWNKSKRTQLQKSTCPMCRDPISNQMRNEMKRRADDVLVSKNMLLIKTVKTYRYLRTGTSDTAIRFQLMTFDKNEPNKKADTLDDILRQKFNPIFHFVMETSDPGEDTIEVKRFVDALFSFLKKFVLFLKHLDESSNSTRTQIVMVKYPDIPLLANPDGGKHNILADAFLIYMSKHVLNKWRRISVFDVKERFRLPEKVNEIRKWYAPLRLKL